MPAGRYRTQSILAILLTLIVVGTIFGTLAQGGAPANHDTLEAYVWGREFQWGYYKHPPFWAWIAGLWFLIAPHTNAAFALLTMINAAVGLFGVWKVAGLYVDDQRRELSVLLLLLTPFFTVFALKFNANTIFLSLWPWTVFAFLRAFETRKIRFAVLFGVLAALDILSKYYAAVLLGTCLIAALAHPSRARYFRSPSPYISLALTALLIAPHLWWLITTGFLPLHYVAGETGHSATFALVQVAHVILQTALALSVVLWLVLRRGHFAIAPLVTDPAVAMLAILAVLPFALTLFAATTVGLILSDNTAGATFAFAPLLLLQLVGQRDWRPMSRLALRLLAVCAPLALIASPAIALARVHSAWLGSPKHADPGQEMALLATNIWHQACGCSLAYVTGDRGMADAIVFYGSDSASELIQLDFKYSPWLTESDIARKGMLIVCRVNAGPCTDFAHAHAAQFERRVSLAHSYAGKAASPMEFDLFVIKPDPQLGHAECVTSAAPLRKYPPRTPGSRDNCTRRAVASGYHLLLPERRQGDRDGT